MKNLQLIGHAMLCISQEQPLDVQFKTVNILLFDGVNHNLEFCDELCSGLIAKLVLLFI